MQLVNLPGAALEERSRRLSHTALSRAHFSAARRARRRVRLQRGERAVRPAAPQPAAPRSRSTSTASSGSATSGARWGRRYYRMAEQLAVREADALIADAQGIADYYDDEFGDPDRADQLRQPNILTDTPCGRDRGASACSPGRFHLVVARFEPENHVDVIVEGYHRSDATLPLVVVGSAPYSAAYTDAIGEIAKRDPRIRLLGGVWDQRLLDQLYAHAAQLRARPLGRRHQPVPAARHGRRHGDRRLGRRLQPRGRRHRRAPTSPPPPSVTRCRSRRSSATRSASATSAS